MSAVSIVREVPARFAAWIEADDESARLPRFRAVFAGIWALYDLIDLAGGMTERSRDWFPHPRDPGLVALQLVLLASGILLMLGKFVWPSGIVAAVARAHEGLHHFPLNDFYFVSVVDLLLAHSTRGPFVEGRRGSPPTWVRDTILFELSFIYLATGILKLNPDWLGGGHLYVRTQYLRLGHHWPYPPPLARALASLAVERTLAVLGAAAEITLAAVLIVRRPVALGVALAVGIHTVGAAMTNVWFFSASMIAGVAILLPGGRGARWDRDGTTGRKRSLPFRRPGGRALNRR